MKSLGFVIVTYSGPVPFSTLSLTLLHSQAADLSGNLFLCSRQMDHIILLLCTVSNFCLLLQQTCLEASTLPAAPICPAPSHYHHLQSLPRIAQHQIRLFGRCQKSFVLQI